jgi:hypothetical protein
MKMNDKNYWEWLEVTRKLRKVKWTKNPDKNTILVVYQDGEFKAVKNK